MNQPKGWLMLSAVLAALMVVAGEADETALWAMTAVGGFLAALPGRIRQRKQPHQRSTWQGCAGCFAAGLAMMLALGMGQLHESLTSGLMQGCASACAFGCMAWLAAFITARWRRKHP